MRYVTIVMLSSMVLLSQAQVWGQDAAGGNAAVVEEAPAASENELKVGVSVVPGETVQPTQVTVQPTQVTVQPTYSYCSPFGDSYCGSSGCWGGYTSSYCYPFSGTCRWRCRGCWGGFRGCWWGHRGCWSGYTNCYSGCWGYSPWYGGCSTGWGYSSGCWGAVRMAGIVPCAELGGGVDQVGFARLILILQAL